MTQTTAETHSGEPELRARFGFRDGDRGTHTRRTMMLSELRQRTVQIGPRVGLHCKTSVGRRSHQPPCITVTSGHCDRSFSRTG